MNQTVTVNISGMVFHIEVDAYEKLKNYLQKIKSFFHNSEESAEIMADIEARIAELFNSRLTSKNQVIVIKDVDEVIQIMGKPEQFAEDPDDTEQEETGKEDHKKGRAHSQRRKNKRIFRDPDDRVFGGVASGLGHSFGIDAVWIRLIWAISLFFFGFGFMLYIILWIIIPEAKTASDKLEMKGEPVNFKNIGRTFEEEAERVRDNFSKMDHKSFGNKVESAFQRFFHFIGALLKGAFKVLGKFIGLALLIAGGILAFFFIATLSSSIMFSGITSEGSIVFDFKNLFITLLGSDHQYEFIKYGLIGLIGIPILGMIYGALRLLFNVRGNNGIGGGLAALWFICLVVVGVIAGQVGLDFSNNVKTKMVVPIDGNRDTFTLKMDEKLVPGEEILNFENDRFLAIDSNYIYYGYPTLDVIQSKDDSVRLRINKRAHGGSRNDAILNAEHISYSIVQNEDQIIFDPYYVFDKEDRWRNQEVKLILEIPVGKAIFLHPSVEDLIFDIDNITDTWDNDMIGHTWIMTNKGLACSDCIDQDLIDDEAEDDTLETL